MHKTMQPKTNTDEIVYDFPNCSYVPLMGGLYFGGGSANTSPDRFLKTNRAWRPKRLSQGIPRRSQNLVSQVGPERLRWPPGSATIFLAFFYDLRCLIVHVFANFLDALLRFLWHSLASGGCFLLPSLTYLL